jgi:hypothetical protein
MRGPGRDTGRTTRVGSEVAAARREARRLIAFERHYSCSGCGHEYRSWSRLPACPDCGEPFPIAVIRRAAIAD